MFNDSLYEYPATAVTTDGNITVSLLPSPPLYWKPLSWSGSFYFYQMEEPCNCIGKAHIFEDDTPACKCGKVKRVMPRTATKRKNR